MENNENTIGIIPDSSGNSEYSAKLLRKSSNGNSLILIIFTAFMFLGSFLAVNIANAVVGKDSEYFKGIVLILSMIIQHFIGVFLALFIFRKTKNVCINMIKKKKLPCISISDIVEDQDGNTDDLEIPDDTDISENLVNTESVQKLQTAIKTLPLLHQEIIRLKFEDEQTNVQIADSLGMNASTVGTILNRSMKKLRKILEEYYHD